MERRQREVKLWASICIVVSTGRDRQGRVSSVGLTDLNNFGGLWGIRTILVVVLDLGVIRAGV